MIKTVKIDDPKQFKIARRDNFDVSKTVSEIIQNVRQNGDKALREYELRFSNNDMADFEVPQSDLKDAYDNLDDSVKELFERAKVNITTYHTYQKREGFTHSFGNGSYMSQRILPLRRAGIYVPGGTAAYPSSVLMNAIPAGVAGVDEIIMATPAKNGKIASEILAAAYLCGINRIFAIGGAQAVAALAYGTESVPRVDVITGPGNIWVATAKKMVYGDVGIDMIAGPSDILIVADNSANAKFVAADLLSQAEHDELAQAILITDNERFADAVKTELSLQLQTLLRCEVAHKSLENNGQIVIVSDLRDAYKISDEIAPEHLEICVENPENAIGFVKNAGSIFLGNYTPETLGDYFAGPNHTLPTGGSSRFSSPLSVDNFVKKSSVLYYDKTDFSLTAQSIAEFARLEGLDAHARSSEVRL